MMKKTCQSNYGFDSKSDKFYVLIDGECKTEEKDFLVRCTECRDLINCTKKDLFISLLQQNASQNGQRD